VAGGGRRGYGGTYPRRPVFESAAVLHSILIAEVEKLEFRQSVFRDLCASVESIIQARPSDAALEIRRCVAGRKIDDMPMPERCGEPAFSWKAIKVSR
jgi:hypothetical protein